MKKNYSTPEFMLVALGSNDLICTSPLENGGTQSHVEANSKRRDIWEDE